jgi:hypothetical protein
MKLHGFVSLVVESSRQNSLEQLGKNIKKGFISVDDRNLSVIHADCMGFHCLTLAVGNVKLHFNRYRIIQDQRSE